MAASREHFGSKLGFILAAAGSAVGIGNIVGFPVAASKNGGGAFLLIYALMVAFICLPVMMAEFAMGRNTQKNPLGAFRELSNNSLVWQMAGYLALITPFMIAVFYTVITVWIFGYLALTISGKLTSLADPLYFEQFINSPMIFVHLIFVAAVVTVILMSGVKNGIERAAKILMPALFFMLLALTAFVLTLDNAVQGVKYYLIPDLTKINAKVISGAMSQAFFSLSLGMGILITYGSYMNRQANLPLSAKLVALTDTSVAFLAGLLVLPAIFSFDPQTETASLSDSSVAMIFTFLPKIFLALEASAGYFGASVIATTFFLLVFFAAITSLVSITEVPLAGIMDEKGLSRKKSLILLLAAMTAFTVACACSFGRVEFLTQFTHYAGADKSFFDVVVDVFYETILPLNGFLVCILVSYRWKKSRLNTEMETGATGYHGTILEKYVDFSLGKIIPLVLLLVFINTVAIKYFGRSLIG